MSQNNTVNSLLKGLRIIEVLNSYNGMNLNKVARLTGYSRGTTYRMLETLRRAGYLDRDKNTGTYWFAAKILGLNDAYIDEAWIWQIARPLMDKLGENLVWPLSLSTAAGPHMYIRTTTDTDSPLTLLHMNTGSRMPLLESSSGMCYLAFCDPKQRTLLIDLTREVNQDKASVPAATSLTRLLNDIRTRGYAQLIRDKLPCTLSVPIVSERRVIACLTVRYFGSSLTPAEAVRRFLVSVRDTAERIGKAYTDLSRKNRRTAQTGP